MANFASNPLLGIVLPIWAYLIGMLIFRRYPLYPITTPLFSGYSNRYLILTITGISYKDYYVVWFLKSVDWTIDSRLWDLSHKSFHLI